MCIFIRFYSIYLISKFILLVCYYFNCNNNDFFYGMIFFSAENVINPPSLSFHTLEQMRKLAGSDRNKFYALSIYYSLTSRDQWQFDNSVKTSNKSVFKSTLEIPMEPFFTTLPSPFFKPSSLQVISYYRVYKLSGFVSFFYPFSGTSFAANLTVLQSQM